MAMIDMSERPAEVHRGRRLEYFTVVWNTLEEAFLWWVLESIVSLK